MPAQSVPETALLALLSGRPVELNPDACLAILQLAEDHELTALATSRLWERRQTLERSLSEEIVTRLTQLHAQAVIEEGMSNSELMFVLAALRGLDTLVLKGPALSALYYPKGARLYRDLDLLVRDEEYDQARDRLRALGYGVMGAYDETIQRRTGKDVAFMRTDDQGVSWSVELHWKLAEPGSVTLDESALWQDTRTLDVEGMAVRTLSDRHTLIHLALNLRKQSFARLKTICDIDRLIRTDRAQLDWERLHREAHDAGICRLLRHALRLSGDLLSTPQPPFPPCGRARGAHTRLLQRLATTETVLADGRPGERIRAVSGVLPFVSLDEWGPILHLARERLLLSPELASYRAGAPGIYRSRKQYVAYTLKRVARALRNIPPAFWSGRRPGADNPDTTSRPRSDDRNIQPISYAAPSSDLASNVTQPLQGSL